jgi:hypothetical protein
MVYISRLIGFPQHFQQLYSIASVSKGGKIAQATADLGDGREKQT